MRRILLLSLFIALLQPSCVIVGGYSSRDGWFFWPGGLGLLVIIVLLLLFLRRRGRG
jgi:hypothetical protein